MRLHEPVLEIAKLNELKEKGFDDESAIKEVLQIRTASLATCVDRIVRVLSYYRGRVRDLKELKDEVSQALKSAEGHVDGIRSYVKGCMAMVPGEAFKGTIGELVLKKNGGVQPLSLAFETEKRSYSNIVPDAVKHDIPAKYLTKVEFWTLNMEEVRKDLPPFSKLEERGSYVDVKI